jgi:HlyD family secretion protein
MVHKKMNHGFLLFGLAGFGVLTGLYSAHVRSAPRQSLPPIIQPARDPYENGIYADGIVERYLSHGKNTNLYPEVSGTVTKILVAEGDSVTVGTILVTVDDSLQRATAEQLRSQAEAAGALLDELKAVPRREVVDLLRAQSDLATAPETRAQGLLEGRRRPFTGVAGLNGPDAFANPISADGLVYASLPFVTGQEKRLGTRPSVDEIKGQERHRDALTMAYAAASALLLKYAIRAPTDGVVLWIPARVGSHVSPAHPGLKDVEPILVMEPRATSAGYLGVRAYVDKLLVPRLAPADKLQAEMFVCGTRANVPLELVRLRQYGSDHPRSLPIVFRFVPAAGLNVYPGEFVDVYVRGK